MKLNERIKYAYASLTVFTLGTVPAMAAQVEANNISSSLNNVSNNIKTLANPIINIALAIVGIIAIGVIIWAYAKKKKGEGGANDGIMDAAWTTLAVVAFIYIVKSFFFGGGGN